MTKNLLVLITCLFACNLFGAIDDDAVDSVREEAASSYYNGDYNRAEELYGQLLDHFQKERNFRLQADALVFLAEIRRAAGQYNLGLASIKEAKILLKERVAKNKNGLAKLYNRKAAIDFEIGELKSAIVSAQKSMAISKEAGIRLFASSNYNILGAAYRDLEMIDSSAHYLKKALRVAEAGGEEDDVVSAALNITLLYRVSDNQLANPCDSQLKYTEFARTIAEKERLRSRLYSIYHELANAYACKENFTKAYHFRSKEAELRDSIRNETSEKRLQETAAMQTLKFQQEKNRLLQEQFGTQRTVLFLAIAVLLIISSLLYYIGKRNKQLRELSKALEESTHNLAKRTEDLSKTNAVKDKMFTVVAHDIRNPLGSLKGVIDLFQDGAMSNDELGTYFKKVSTQLTQTEVLLDNLLSWSRSQVEDISVNKTTIKIFDEINEELKGLRHMAREKEIDLIFECSDSIEISADKNILKFIIRNLTTNALKFSKSGSEVRVLVLEQKDSNQLRIDVIDEGIGMSTEQVQKLFTGLNNKSLGTSSEKGSGLGLFMSKELAQKHGGDIYVSSELGKGSTFTFEIKRD